MYRPLYKPSDPPMLRQIDGSSGLFTGNRILLKGPVKQANMQGLRMDREQMPTFARVLRDCRFWTVQNSASRTDWRVSNAD